MKVLQDKVDEAMHVRTDDTKETPEIWHEQKKVILAGKHNEWPTPTSSPHPPLDPLTAPGGKIKSFPFLFKRNQEDSMQIFAHEIFVPPFQVL